MRASLCLDVRIQRVSPNPPDGPSMTNPTRTVRQVQRTVDTKARGSLPAPVDSFSATPLLSALASPQLPAPPDTAGSHRLRPPGL